MVSGLASSSTWLVMRDELIVAAYSAIEDAATLASTDGSLSIKHAPEYIDSARFVWAVISPENQFDSAHGGDSLAATRRAQAIGGEIRLFKALE